MAHWTCLVQPLEWEHRILLSCPPYNLIQAFWLASCVLLLQLFNFFKGLYRLFKWIKELCQICCPSILILGWQSHCWSKGVSKRHHLVNWRDCAACPQPNSRGDTVVVCVQEQEKACCGWYQQCCWWIGTPLVICPFRILQDHLKVLEHCTGGQKLFLHNWCNKGDDHYSHHYHGDCWS